MESVSSITKVTAPIKFDERDGGGRNPTVRERFLLTSTREEE
jgi:hypothetical protein